MYVASVANRLTQCLVVHWVLMTFALIAPLISVRATLQ